MPVRWIESPVKPVEGLPTPGTALRGIGQGLQKDVQAKQLLEMPGMRESMGPEVAGWVGKGPGAHKRLGMYLSQADRVSGGRVTQTKKALDIVSQMTGGKVPASQSEALRLWMSAAQQVGLPNDAAMQTFKVAWPQVSRAGAGIPAGTRTELIKRRLPETREGIVELGRREAITEAQQVANKKLTAMRTTLTTGKKAAKEAVMRELREKYPSAAIGEVGEEVDPEDVDFELLGRMLLDEETFKTGIERRGPTRIGGRRPGTVVEGQPGLTPDYSKLWE